MEFYNHSQRYGDISPINAKSLLKSHQSIGLFLLNVQALFVRY